MKLQVHQPGQSPHIEEPLQYARQVIRTEAAALEQAADRLGPTFLKAADLLFQCQGRVAITGTGKSADVGQKIAGTLNSTGTRSYLLDATRALHGDLGMVHADDIVLILSHSGESEEIVRLLDPLRQLSKALIALTSNGHNTLARRADVAITYGPLEEACPHGLAPSTSTTAMLAIGDALAFLLCRMRDFSRKDFARYHPAGSLGRQFLKVDALMRRGPELRLASFSQSVREVFAKVRMLGRRTGALMLTDEDGRLCGLFTDSDLARLFEERRDEALDRPVREVMTADPRTIGMDAPILEAVSILARYKISELPVIDSERRPVGLLDITDVIGLLPVEARESLERGSWNVERESA
ncbi:MAG: SIS domain-containing protein [Gemmataceae bacterium]